MKVFRLPVSILFCTAYGLNATIDKTWDAEALVGQVLVKPYVDEVRVLLNKPFIQQTFIEHLLCLGCFTGCKR